MGLDELLKLCSTDDGLKCFEQAALIMDEADLILFDIKLDLAKIHKMLMACAKLVAFSGSSV
jgi:hypothetical protein